MKSKVATGVARRLLMTVAVIALAPAAFANRVEQMERIPNLSLCSIIQVTRTSISCLVSTTDVSSSAISVMALLLRITATCWFQKVTTQWRTSPTCRLVTSPPRHRRSASTTGDFPISSAFGKSKKDRYVILSPNLIERLNEEITLMSCGSSPMARVVCGGCEPSFDRLT